MIENMYDRMERQKYHEKHLVKQVKSVIGDDDSMNLPITPHLIQKQSIHTPAVHKNYDMINMSESIHSNSNTLKLNNEINTNTQNLINTKQALNDTIEGFIIDDKKRNISPQNTVNSNELENKIEEIVIQLNSRSNSKKQQQQKQQACQESDNSQENHKINYEEQDRKEKGEDKNEVQSELDEDEEEENGDPNNQKKRNDGLSTRRSLHNSSSLQLEDYFNQDVDRKKKEQMDRIINDITKFKSYFVRFRLNLFFEFYFYHALFVIFFGPLANPIIYKFGKGLPRNLLFWGNNYGFYYQTVFYILSLSAIILYAYYHTNYVFFQSEFVYLFIGMVYRIFTIATKYATFDPFKIEAIKQNVFDLKELQSDFFLRDWREQKDRIIFEEIYFAQRAYDIDPSWFYLEFIVNPEQETKDRLGKNNFVLSQFFNSKDQTFQPQPINITNKDTEVFYIYGVIKEIADNFQVKYKFAIDHASSIAFVYSIIRALIPTIYKLADHDIDFLSDSQWYEWIISFNIAFLTYKLYYFTVWTILQGIIDMKRKIYMMEQMAFMISPRKLRSIDVDKLFPTINIFKSSNLKAWQLMRHVCQEYGKRYDIRVQANFSGMILVIIVAIVILSLNYTNVITLEPCFTVVIIIETVCTLLVLIQILYNGAKINEQFELHDAILTYNKSIVMDIYRMRRRYFCDQFKTTNYLYSKAVQKIRDEVAMLKMETPCSYLKEIVLAYDTHIDELKFDQSQNPFKIGSIKITNGLLESGIIGVVSVIVAIVGKFLSNRLED